MNDVGRKKVVVFLFIAWVLLFAFFFTEELGYFHDTDEYANQSIEQTLSSPVLATADQNLGGRLAALAFISIIVFVRLKPAKSLFQPLYLSIMQELSHPPDFPKIYQFISTYRI